MPLVSRAFVLTGLLHLMLAMVIGIALVLAAVGAPVPPLPYPVYVHLLGVGWLTQLIFGVAYWMFPGRTRQPSWAELSVLWSVYGLLNAGLVLRAVAESMLGRPGQWPELLVFSAVAQLLAILGFVWHLWPRVARR